jgi:hypothetical protein
MRTLILALTLALTLSPAWGTAAEVWRCVPEQILIGEWHINIQSDSGGVQATTSYAADIVPNMKLLVQEFNLTEEPIDEGFSYTGQNFALEIYPLRVPARNPFLPNRGAVSAQVISVQFAPGVKLVAREYVCLPL